MGSYRCGNPVLAVDEAELAVQVVKSGELRGRKAALMENYRHWGPAQVTGLRAACTTTTRSQPAAGAEAGQGLGA